MLRLPTSVATYDSIELTHREREILTLLASGLSTSVIVEKLRIRSRTVGNHVNNILFQGKGKVMIRTVAVLSCLLLAVLGVHASVTDGPIQYNGNDYYLLSSQTWTQADAEAVALGCDLVSINDQAEQDFIYGLAAANIYTGHWIGLNDRDIEGTWAWTSGDPVTYTYWSLPWEPNGGLTENCGVRSWRSSSRAFHSATSKERPA